MQILWVLCFSGVLLQDHFLLASYCNRYLLANYSINASSLSITGFQFNTLPGPSEWVNRLFFSPAVLWTEPILFRRWKNQATVSNVPDALNNFRTRFEMPQSAVWPDCSIEMLGFVPLHVTYPFMGTEKHVNLSIGTATLSCGHDKSDVQPWQCFYRGVYENWLNFESKEDSYRAVLFYCTAPTGEKSCDSFFHYNISDVGGIISCNVEMDVPAQNPWTAEIFILSQTIDDCHSISPTAEQIALCTAWPYQSSIGEKVEINAALMFEYLRYHAKLNFRMIVFDKSQTSLRRIFSTVYARAMMTDNDDTADIFSHIDYHNFTVLSIIKGSTALSLSDREDKSQGRRGFEFDLDKALSLTHCRFEARAKYGIEKVLVSDFDEFLYCPQRREGMASSASAAANLSSFLFRELNSLISEGVEQLILDKVQLLRKRADTTIAKCLVKQLQKAENQVQDGAEADNISIFECFPSVRKVDHVSNMKSLHIRYVCPYTNFHHSCAPTVDTLNSYDCLCRSKRPKSCSLYHLSLPLSDYHKRPMNSYQDELTEFAHCELKEIAESPASKHMKETRQE